jgi:hypothetical protein
MGAIGAVRPVAQAAFIQGALAPFIIAMRGASACRCAMTL